MILAARPEVLESRWVCRDRFHTKDGPLALIIPSKEKVSLIVVINRMALPIFCDRFLHESANPME